MKKVLQKMSLLGMLLMLCIGSAYAEDVTATWDWQKGVPASITSTNIQGKDATGTVDSDVEGIKLSVQAAVAGTNIKLQYNSSGYAQFNQNTAIRVPVKTKGDLVTVVSYPGQSNYIVGGEDAKGQNTFSHTAKVSEASQGYVEIVASATAYLYSISVTQYAPKAPVTLDNEAVVATFPFTLGTEGQKATFDKADYWIGSKVATGSNMGIKDFRAISDVTFTRIQPQTTSAAAAENDYVFFRIQPKFGFTFTPTSVALKAYKDGTGNGKLTLKWVTSDGTETEIAKDVDIQRNNATPPYSTLSYESISGVTPVEGYCGLKVYIGGNLSTGKQVGLSDIVINGTLSGTEKEVPVLGSFTINGTAYSVEDVFEDQYEATLKLSKKEAMVSASNPVTTEVVSGEIGTVTYEGDETKCTVTIPMTAGDLNVNYVLSVVQKPDYTLTYYDVDGTTVLDTQVLEEDQTIGEFKVDIADVKATQEGYKARGWFKNNYVGEKHQVTDVVTSDLSLYAVQTEIEVSSESRKYVFDLTDKNFDPADHEAFNPTGGTPNVSDMRHGWAFSTGNTIDLLVGSKASIILTLCQYAGGNATIDATIGSKAVSVPAKTATDGAVQAIEYEGEPGTLTLTINGGQAYIHKLTILNTAETNYDKEGQWIKVKAGDASSFIAALDAANGTTGDERIFIYLPNGTYDLGQTALTTIGRNNVSIIGESMEGTIIKNRPVKEGIAITATLLNTATNTYMQDLTLDCIAPYGTGDDTKEAERGVCLQDKGTQTICKNVYLKGLQDTYYSNGGKTQKALFDNCSITGTVDFLCGGGDVVFNKTQLYVTLRSQKPESANVIVAPNTDAETQWGYVMLDCTVDGNEGQASKYNLARPWNGSPAATWINTVCKLAPSTKAYGSMTANLPLRFHEYNTKDADGNAITGHTLEDCKGADASDALYIDETKAATYTIDNVLGSWAATAKNAIVQAAAPKAELKGNVITITPANDAAAGNAYLIEKDGEFLALTSETTYTIEDEAEGNAPTANPVYTVRASNAMGGFGEAATVVDPTGVEVVKAAADGAQASEGVFVVNGKVVIVKDGKQYTAAGARIK